MDQAWDKGRDTHADHEVLTPGFQVMGTEAQPDLVPNPLLGLQLETLSTSRDPGELRDKEASTRPQAFFPQPDGHRDRPRLVADLSDQLGLRSCMRTQEYGPSKVQRRRHLGRSASKGSTVRIPSFPTATGTHWPSVFRHWRMTPSHQHFLYCFFF